MKLHNICVSSNLPNAFRKNVELCLASGRAQKRRPAENKRYFSFYILN